VLLALLYLLLIDPAVEGRASCNRSLPQLRQQAAELQAMARKRATWRARRDPGRAADARKPRQPA
jgi:type II secretory pathway component PulM